MRFQRSVSLIASLIFAAGANVNAQSASAFDQSALPDAVRAGRGAVLPGDGDRVLGVDRRKAYDLQPSDGARWLLYSNLPPGQGAHSTFNLEDLDSPDPAVAAFSRALSSTVRAFLDAHVVGDEAAKAWLLTDAAKAVAGDASWEHK